MNIIQLSDPQCTRCGEKKPREDFPRDLRKKNKLGSWCNDCLRIYQRKKGRERYKDPKIKKKLNKRCADAARKYPERYIFNRAKSRAKKQGLDFNLSIEDIVIPEICPLLGIKIKMGVYTGKSGTALDSSPSLDRIDSTKGYIKGNIGVISFLANMMKNKATPKQIKTIAENIDEYTKSIPRKSD